MARGHTLVLSWKTSFSQNGSLRFLTRDRDLGAKKMWKMIVWTFRIFLDLSKSSEIQKIGSLLRHMVGIWSKSGQGRKIVKKVKNWKVLRMGLPVVENVSGLQESIFSLSRGPQLHFGEKSKKYKIWLDLAIFPFPPCLGSLGLLSCSTHLMLLSQQHQHCWHLHCKLQHCWHLCTPTIHLMLLSQQQNIMRMQRTGPLAKGWFG